MLQILPGLLATIIGATAALLGSWLAAKWQERAVNRRWLREQKRQLYTDALRSLARATVIPIGTSTTSLESWFRELALVRESLVALQVYSRLAPPELSAASQRLFAALDANDFAIVATDAATIREDGVNHAGFVLWGVGRIRRELDSTLDAVVASARLDLQADISG